jgi:hypothetical protein
MQRLTEADFDALCEATGFSLWPQFWLDLLVLVRATRRSPIEILGRRPLPRCPESVQEAARRIRAEECPYGVRTSRYARDAMERGLRSIGRQAGLEGWEELRFESLC